jgi:NAD(P)-dependent dehydrogenase (short-subunit alcohol dehydrogenase family)
MPELYHHYFARNPMGPEEIANAAVFLCSTAASFITGSSLVVDGRWTGRVNY